ncbi:putative reverse transcriptase zinc-binding domain-containing protein [Helianthus annuus]|uniref:Reverse transcriptase zinc-binding domain-containing protein n=1 Tax=Helianthus annuus TaxID=4232 RepID=A0A9K3E9W3_HELAN|nr:putative reverse transcriptase zinc-binding domain-containing protein [Helianthus annuus]KAJ0464641.1 putative reverse transcriptase zinc-binding domain-containing protein [Helianthus annuus]KAJ0469267.1 putative reverse transcriptase zinc-binding domain-containing protein [Helianthus annuus]KAJ0486238.1 putative reverse transcriptase zinc-binding domain-containing protein [Helianthus annuus]KAJ0656790.1 putative reverse transcriptase zinc-binding domain-containing protein [Helianthus annuus
MISISNVQFSRSIDTWVWVEEAAGEFSVASVKRAIYKARNVNLIKTLDWNSWAPIKLSLFGWRLSLRMLPTMDELIKRRICWGPNGCCLCHSAEESVDHIFTECIVAAVVLQQISVWCKIAPFYAFSIEDLFGLHKLISGSSIKKGSPSRYSCYLLEFMAGEKQLHFLQCSSEGQKHIGRDEISLLLLG